MLVKKETSFRLEGKKRFNSLLIISLLLLVVVAFYSRETYSREREMLTRLRKRKVGQRDSLWDLIVNNDDICFQHILPRLNGTDIKFLYEVNSETRKLIKRSSRASDLEKKFKVEEMSSISTLEVAWEHKSLWPRDCERSFCSQVSKTNKLELLKWIREEKKCEWDGWTLHATACHNNLEMRKYCKANECPNWTCAPPK